MFFDDYSRDFDCDGPDLLDSELIEAYLIEFDPVVDGCEPVFVGLYAVGSRDGFRGYEVRQTATATANMLFVKARVLRGPYTRGSHLRPGWCVRARLLWSNIL